MLLQFKNMNTIIFKLNDRNRNIPGMTARSAFRQNVTAKYRPVCPADIPCIKNSTPRSDRYIRKISPFSLSAPFRRMSAECNKHAVSRNFTTQNSNYYIFPNKNTSINSYSKQHSDNPSMLILLSHISETFSHIHDSFSFS